MADGSSNELLGTKSEGVSSQESPGKMTRASSQELLGTKSEGDSSQESLGINDESFVPGVAGNKIGGSFVPGVTADKLLGINWRGASS